MINAAGLQSNAIVVSIRSEQVEEFERLFAVAGHTAHDRDGRFNAFLAKARAFQPSEPFVWGGTTVHARPEWVPDHRPADEG